MKKTTALLLTLLMMFLQVTAAIAETDTAEEVINPAFAENVELLTALGIFSGRKDNPNELVTRAKFADAVVKLFGWDNISFDDSAPLPFVDVKSGRDNLNSIKITIELGLMNGFNAVEFRPDDCVTYVQAVKVLTSALGYAPFAEQRGGWPVGYMLVGQELDLLLGRDFTNNEPITWDMLVSMFVRALQAEALELSTLSDVIIYSKDKDRYLLNVYHDIYQAEGVLTDNGVSALNGASQTAEGYVILNGVQYGNSYAPLADLLGQSVEYYYRDDAGKRTVLYGAADKNLNDVLVITAENLETNSGDFSKTAIVYSEGDKTRTAKISPYADFIYNGGADPDFTSADFKIRSGQLTLIDSDDDGVYDTVLAEEYEDVFVSGVNTSQEAVHSQYHATINYGNYKTYSFVDATGAVIDPAFITAGSILSVYASRDKESVKMVLCTEAMEVVPSELTEEGERKVFAADEQTYYLSVSLSDAIKSTNNLIKSPELGSSYQAYFNYMGEIAMLQEITPKYEYAYALGVQTGKGLASNTGMMKLYLASNDCVTVNAAEKVNINGVKQNGGEIVNVADFYDGTTFVPQLVKIKRNTKGQLIELETTQTLSTATSGFESDKFTLNLSGTYEVYTGGKMPSINYSYGYDENTKIFLINRSASEDLATTSEDDIIAVSGADLSSHYTRRPKVMVYDADEALVAGAVVMSSPTVGNTHLIWIENCKLIMDEFGETRLQVDAYWKNNKWTFRESESGVFAEAIKYFHETFNQDYKSMSDAEKEAVLARDTALQPGDALSITFDADDEISYASLQASPMRELGAAGYGKVDLSTLDTATNLTRGNLVVKTDKRLGVATADGYVAMSLPASAACALILNVRSGRLTRVEVADLPTNGYWTEYGTVELTDPNKSFVVCYNRGLLREILMVEK